MGRRVNGDIGLGRHQHVADRHARRLADVDAVAHIGLCRALSGQADERGTGADRRRPILIGFALDVLNGDRRNDQIVCLLV